MNTKSSISLSISNLGGTWIESLGFGTPSAVSGSSATCDAALCSELKGINQYKIWID